MLMDFSHYISLVHNYRDGVSGSVNSWSSNSNCGLRPDGYHAYEASPKTYSTCYLAESNYGNFTIQVDLKVIRGDCGGIVFRSNGVSGQEYLFRVCQDNQRYYLYNCPGRGRSCQELNSNLNLDFDIHQGLNATNKIALVVGGGQIGLYINGASAASISDSTYRSGAIGLVASTINNRTEVVYSNLTIWV